MPQSTVPAVLTNLVTLFTAAAPAGCPVYLGPLPGSDIPPDYVTVGHADDNMPSVVGSAEASDMGDWAKVYAEKYQVLCALSTSSGDELAAARMARADTIFQALMVVLRNNRTLSGAITPPGVASLGSYQWQIEEGGSIVTIFFNVDVVAPWVGA